MTTQPRLALRLSLPQASRQTGVTTQTLRRWIRHGKVQAQKGPTGRWWVSRETVIALIAGRWPAVDIPGEARNMKAAPARAANSKPAPDPAADVDCERG